MSNLMKKNLKRRDFLKTSLMSGAAVTFVPLLFANKTEDPEFNSDLKNFLKNNSFNSLIDNAFVRMTLTADALKRWADAVRPPDGARGRFRWSVKTVRDANVGSTRYVLQTLEHAGIFDSVITKEDREEGIKWISSMDVGNSQYRDPAICSRKAPGWPESTPWPSPAMMECMNRYAIGALNSFGVPDVLVELPPPGWPQKHEADKVLDWLKKLPWDKNAWGAGSHACKMTRWLTRWYTEGAVPLEYVVAALKYIYSWQDPQTGLWGNPSLPLFNKINGTFKLSFLLIQELGLPLPYADKIIDSVFKEFYRPDYDKTAGGCDEFDNWQVMLFAASRAHGHREEELRKMAAYRMSRILELAAKPDGGLSYFYNRCATAWTEIDMAPSLPQGDAVGAAVITSGISICIELLGIEDKTSWKSMKMLDDQKKFPASVKEKIYNALMAEVPSFKSCK